MQKETVMARYDDDEEDQCYMCEGKGVASCPLEYGGRHPDSCPSCGGSQKLAPCPSCDGTGKD